jgi:hypothetical protein
MPQIGEYCLRGLRQITRAEQARRTRNRAMLVSMGTGTTVIAAVRGTEGESD